MYHHCSVLIQRQPPFTNYSSNVFLRHLATRLLLLGGLGQSYMCDEEVILRDSVVQELWIGCSEKERELE